MKQEREIQAVITASSRHRTGNRHLDLIHIAFDFHEKISISAVIVRQSRFRQKVGKDQEKSFGFKSRVRVKTVVNVSIKFKEHLFRFFRTPVFFKRCYFTKIFKVLTHS